MSVLGVLVGGISVGFFKLAAFGVDPFQSFMSGVDQLFALDFGTLYIIVNALLLLFALVFDRHYIGLATFINLFLLGYVVQFSYDTLLALFPGASLGLRLMCFLGGFTVLCLSASLYITADLGVSTYDAVALIWSEKQKRIPFFACRVITDFLCVLCGILLCALAGYSLREITGQAGIGTIITAFFMGPLIDLFSARVAKPFLFR